MLGGRWPHTNYIRGTILFDNTRSFGGLQLLFNFGLCTSTQPILKKLTLDLRPKIGVANIGQMEC